LTQKIAPRSASERPLNAGLFFASRLNFLPCCVFSRQRTKHELVHHCYFCILVDCHRVYGLDRTRPKIVSDQIKSSCGTSLGAGDKGWRSKLQHQAPKIIVNQSSSHAFIYHSLTFLLAEAERWIKMDWMNAVMLCATLLVVGAVFYVTSLEMRNR